MVFSDHFFLGSESPANFLDSMGMKVSHEDFRQMAKILIGTNDDAKLSNEISGNFQASF